MRIYSQPQTEIDPVNFPESKMYCRIEYNRWSLRGLQRSKIEQY